MVGGRVQTHRNPPFCAEGRHPPQLLVWYVDRHGKCGRVGVAELVVVVHLGYPPALVGYALQRDARDTCEQALRVVEITVKLDLDASEYLSSVFGEGVIHLPAILGKDLPVFEGKYLLCGECGETVMSACTAPSRSLRAQCGVTLTHQPVGNRKGKFHQHFKNGLPECVLHLFVCKP